MTLPAVSVTEGGTAAGNESGAPGPGRAAERDVEHFAVERVLPAWRRVTGTESRWPVLIAIVLVVVLQLRLAPELGIRPRWLLPGLEMALGAVLLALNPVRLTRSTRVGRWASLLLVAAVTADNVTSAVLLGSRIVTGRSGSDAVSLLANAAAIYLTNIIAFGIWYWELDRGGPFARAAGTAAHPDFLFPQMSTPGIDADWEPTFVDYLYVSFTNATAFSPTDTMPLARWAKLLMGVQAAVALATTALVVARAVNILK